MGGEEGGVKREKKQDGEREEEECTRIAVILSLCCVVI